MPEVAPVFVEGLADLIVVLLAIGLFLLRVCAAVFVFAMLNSIADLLGHIPVVGGIAKDAIKGSVRVVEGALASAQRNVDNVAVGIFHAMGATLVYLGATVEELASETAHAVHAITHVSIPNAVNQAIDHAIQGLSLLQAQVARIEHHALVDIRAGVSKAQAAAGAAAAGALAAERAIHHAIAVTIPGEIDRVTGRIGVLVHETYSSLNRRLTEVEKAVGVGALTGVVLAVIAKHYGWLRCKNLPKAAKGICGISESELEALLAGALLIASTISIVEFAKACQGFTNEVEKPLTDFVRELRDAKLVPGPNATSALARYAAGRY